MVQPKILCAYIRNLRDLTNTLSMPVSKSSFDSVEYTHKYGDHFSW